MDANPKITTSKEATFSSSKSAPLFPTVKSPSSPTFPPILPFLNIIHRASIQNRRASEKKSLNSLSPSLRLDPALFKINISTLTLSPNLSNNILVIIQNLNINTLPTWLSRLTTTSGDLTNLQVFQNNIDYRTTSVPLNETYSTSISESPLNLSKNRYTDILPFNKNRVILNGTDDYINASHIVTCNSYIACQGPLNNTVDDFWRMVVENKSSVVVCLTNLEERQKVKCAKYWPDDGQVMETNNFILRLESLESFYNELHVRVINVFSRIDGKSRRIWHCHFQGWPDYQKSNCVNVLTVIDLMNYLITRSEYEQCQGIPSGNISFLQNQRFGRSDIDLRAFLNSVQGEEFNGECTINNDVDDEMLRVTTRDMAIDQDATISSPVHVKRESIPSQLHSKSLFSIQLTKESSFVAAKRYVGPPILHCSAGCGRTGTMITIDTICRMLLFSTQEDIEYDLVFAVVDYLREQRVSMVQSLDQFAFCYEAILTWIAERRKRGLKDTWAAEI